MTGILYKKAGVMLTDLIGQDIQQEDLFAVSDSEGSKRLMQVVETINKHHGRGTIAMAASGLNEQRWRMRTDLKSPAYLSQWKEIRVAKG